MKNQALIFALGTLFFGHVYSSDPLAAQGLGKIPQENGIFASELQRYKVAHYPTYVKTPLKQRNVIKKSLVEINSENAVDITRVFIDSLGEALEDTNTAVGDRLDTRNRAIQSNFERTESYSRRNSERFDQYSQAKS